jgi:capsule polysaccharide export protein KpsE/RkpR
MKHKIFTLTLLSVAVLAMGCDKEPTTSEQIDKVKAETKDSAQDMKDYTYAQKDEFTAKMQAELTVINNDLDQLSAKIEKSSDDIKAQAKPKLQALRDQAAQLNKQLDDVKNSTASTWDSVKAGTQKAYDSLKDGFQQSRQWVSDKIAP